MSQCETCGNEYDKAFVIRHGGEEHTFDCFECAIQALAPTCDRCDTRIVGHGIEADGRMYCCAHCARSEGQEAAVDRIS